MSRTKIPVNFINLKKLTNGESTTNKHHRKPRSHGGRRSKRNISKVDKSAHIAFHGLFQKDGKPMRPPEVAEVMATLFPMIEALYMIGDGSRRLMTREEVIGEMNKIWIDPDFVLYISSEIEDATSSSSCE